MLQLLIDATPSLLARKPDARAMLPLHLACVHQASRVTVQALLPTHRAAPSELCYEGRDARLPLHLAVTHGAPLDVIHLLMSDEADGRAALHTRDGEGLLPLLGWPPW